MRISNGIQNRNRRMPNGTYGGVRGRKTKVGRKLLRFPPTRLYIIMWELLYEILRRNTLVILYAADSLSKHISDGELLNLVATLGVRD